MQNLIDSVEKSLGMENWYGAIAVALTIPDVCASLQHGQTNRDRYADWFNKHLGAIYGPTSFLDGKAWLTGKQCYALRSVLLHNVSDKITPQELAEVRHWVKLTAIGPHCFVFTDSFGIPNTNVISISHFSKDLIAAANAFLVSVQGDAAVQTRIGQMLEIHTGPIMPIPPQAQAQKPAPASPPPGRNEPCPCGSGKKFKHCHGAIK